MLVALVSEIFVESVQKAAETFGMSPAFVGFIIVSLVGAAAEFAVAFSAARKDRLDMSVSIALGSASQIALFVAPALVLLSYVVGPSPMSLQFWPGAVTMVMIATVTASFITSSGRSAWFVGALLIFIYAIFALTLYVVPPAGQRRGEADSSFSLRPSALPVCSFNRLWRNERTAAPMRHGSRSETRSLTDQTKSMGETTKKAATGPKG